MSNNKYIIRHVPLNVPFLKESPPLKKDLLFLPYMWGDSLKTITMTQAVNKENQQLTIKRYNRCAHVEHIDLVLLPLWKPKNQEGLSPEGFVTGIINYRIAVKQYITADRFTYQAKVWLYCCFTIGLMLCVVISLIVCLFCRKLAETL